MDSHGAGAGPETLSEQEAYRINLYNALTVDLVLVHYR
ncbi:MAG: DUF547 domain-containing protein [Pseudomonadota bacterium]|nr:DUF547 domain-containing protein [Pseudomonadota bacterium]